MNKKTIYYVSSYHGDDTNCGTTKEAPFQSLRKINELQLKPGDQVLLERGSQFKEQYLHLYQSGTKEEPIVIDAYGDGELPRIETKGNGIWYQNYGGPLDNVVHTWRGTVSSSILLYDVEYIMIQNIEITNDGLKTGESFSQGDRMSRTGVSVIAKNKGTLHNITLGYLFIHDVLGNVYDKHLNNGAIYFSALKPDKEEETGIARYDRVHIHHCKIARCRRWGIAVGYTYQHNQFTTIELADETVRTYGSTNVLIEHNQIREIGGDGITPMYCFEPVVQYNVSENIAMDMNDHSYTEAGIREGKTAAAMWPWKCKTALFQYNEAFSTYFNQDGEAWDADSGDGTIYQYNYSHDNKGGCIMFCEGESINTIFRYNISQNDGTGTITPVRNPNAHIYNNTFCIPEGVPFIRHDLSGGGMLVENNIIFYMGETARQEDWHHHTPNTVYHNNLYYNYANTPEEDAQAVLAKKHEVVLENPGSAPSKAREKVNQRTGLQTMFDGYRLPKTSLAAGTGKEIIGWNGTDFFERKRFGKPSIGAVYASDDRKEKIIK